MDIDRSADAPRRPTLSDLMRLWFRWILDPAGGFLIRLGLAPNTITLAGLAGNFIAALYLASGNFLVGGLLVLAMGPVDALDGTMARLRGESSDWGAFVDSVSDRYSELFILGGLIVRYLSTGDRLGAGLAFGAAAGSVLVSYTKARAESLGYEARGGILTRFERYLVLVPALLLGFDRIGLGVITVLANLTALQRIWIVRRQARRR
jgi:CDP-diacylglycerol--glycerol-3-phosphate 3-phosphatidyltransferase